MKSILIFAICFQCFPAISSDFQTFLGVLSKVESRDNDKAVGDGGNSIGRYQIGKLYFIDAQSFNTNLNKYSWRDCFNGNVSEQVVRAYMLKYEPVAVRNNDWEVLARLHNSGPRWRNKKHLTNKYWFKIKYEMDSINNSWPNSYPR